MSGIKLGQNSKRTVGKLEESILFKKPVSYLVCRVPVEFSYQRLVLGDILDQLDEKAINFSRFMI